MNPIKICFFLPLLNINTLRIDIYHYEHTHFLRFEQKFLFLLYRNIRRSLNMTNTATQNILKLLIKKHYQYKKTTFRIL